MIRQCLSNKNESATVAKNLKFCQLNKARVTQGAGPGRGTRSRASGQPGGGSRSTWLRQRRPLQFNASHWLAHACTRVRAMSPSTPSPRHTNADAAQGRLAGAGGRAGERNPTTMANEGVRQYVHVGHELERINLVPTVRSGIVCFNKPSL